MRLTRNEIQNALAVWNEAWANYDLKGVIGLFDDEILFDNWTGGRVKGKEKLRQAWAGWFENNEGFRFTEEDTFIDEGEQKVLFRWRLDWPSMEKGHEGKPEVRRGVDVMAFRDGKIFEKLTYSKTTVDIESERIPLTA
ncbi:MAG: nuclear transport factor 2 family protein [Proteobacteria bacterium]|nr:nuclear transport factor 2 family protein [Pseudomonadota bacterium]